MSAAVREHIQAITTVKHPKRQSPKAKARSYRRTAGFRGRAYFLRRATQTDGLARVRVALTTVNSL